VGTKRCAIAAGDDQWGGRAANAWIHELSHGTRFDESSQRLYDLSVLIDAIYGRQSG
jgi:hypothetical protein